MQIFQESVPIPLVIILRAHLLSSPKWAVVLPAAVVRSPRGGRCYLRQIALYRASIKEPASPCLTASLTLVLHSAVLLPTGVDTPPLFQSCIEAQNAPLTNQLLCFARGTRRQTKPIHTLFAPAGANSTRFFESLTPRFWIESIRKRGFLTYGRYGFANMEESRPTYSCAISENVSLRRLT